MEEILNQIRTKDEAEKLKAEIDTLLSSMYKSKEGIDHALKTQVRFQIAELFRKKLAPEAVNTTSFLNDLKKKLDKIKVMILGVAYEPNDESIERLSDYVNSSFGEKILLEINYMPELIAGAVVIFEGKYSDFSVRKIFEKEFRESEEEILSLLNQTIAR